ncbi:NYN domain-containing protein [Corynebacterium pacaense]|uniref:NYN domain-containing protein n=1 Tax=Corynebacterium pacaense TaxID=1816684 RepID=UPI0009BB22A5|nr:NYN domain-containing protein [Corynebacterium pacaense]
MEPRTRRIHFIDIENLCETAIVTERNVADALTDYIQHVGIDNDDLVTIAANTTNASISYLTAHRMLSACFVPPASGRDAADLALIEAITGTPRISTFDTVFIASGDHIFAPVLDRLAVLGVNTVAVSRAWSLSPHVRLAAHSTITFPHLTHTRRFRSQCAPVIDITTRKEIA